jgi:hypothetical protein
MKYQFIGFNLLLKETELLILLSLLIFYDLIFFLIELMRFPMKGILVLRKK